MVNVGETALSRCTYLGEEYFGELYSTFSEAFSDYVYPFALSEEQFRNHLALNAVDLTRTAGCFADGRLVAFSLNGFGDWSGMPTVYDAGTGVIPAYRRRGISEAMFEMMLPRFKADGIRQFLLEVITENSAAVRLYEKLGFYINRELALLQCDGPVKMPRRVADDIEVKVLDEPDWPLFNKFWDGLPSWQNSPDAIGRIRKNRCIKAAFIDGRCVGYIIYSSRFGRTAQMAVDHEFRHHGVGTALLKAMEADTADGYSMQVINIDKALPGALEFFADHGFYERLAQYEMILPI
jgi:ribosomal protein S18 acetylase RimI-like enzyme